MVVLIVDGCTKVVQQNGFSIVCQENLEPQSIVLQERCFYLAIKLGMKHRKYKTDSTIFIGVL